MATMSRTLPWVTVRGGPYERGLQHGWQCGDLIARYADTLLRTIRQEAAWRALPIDPSLDRDSLLARGLAFLPQYEAFAPHLVEEMRGIADGAKLNSPRSCWSMSGPRLWGYDLTMRPAIHLTLWPCLGDGCTAFALGRTATADGEIVAGQNLDQDPAERRSAHHAPS